MIGAAAGGEEESITLIGKLQPLPHINLSANWMVGWGPRPEWPDPGEDAGPSCWPLTLFFQRGRPVMRPPAPSFWSAIFFFFFSATEIHKDPLLLASDWSLFLASDLSPSLNSNPIRNKWKWVFVDPSCLGGFSSALTLTFTESYSSNTLQAEKRCKTQPRKHMQTKKKEKKRCIICWCSSAGN